MIEVILGRLVESFNSLVRFEKLPLLSTDLRFFSIVHDKVLSEVKIWNDIKDKKLSELGSKNEDGSIKTYKDANGNLVVEFSVENRKIFDDEMLLLSNSIVKIDGEKFDFISKYPDLKLPIEDYVSLKWLLL